MTTKPWGDEPYNPYKQQLSKEEIYLKMHGVEVSEEYKKSEMARDMAENHKKIIEKEKANKLEAWCIALKVPHPDLPQELRELILESRRLDSVEGESEMKQCTLCGKEYKTHPSIPQFTSLCPACDISETRRLNWPQDQHTSKPDKTLSESVDDSNQDKTSRQNN